MLNQARGNVSGDAMVLLRTCDGGAQKRIGVIVQRRVTRNVGRHRICRASNRDAGQTSTHLGCLVRLTTLTRACARGVGRICAGGAAAEGAIISGI